MAILAWFHTFRPVEKLVYLLWNQMDETSASQDDFRDRLLSMLPDVLERNGATRLKISVTDRDVAGGERLHLGPHRPAALVSFWLECVQDRMPCEQILASCGRRHAGYLVVESQPLRIETPADRVGNRMPGFSLVGCIERADGISHSEFIDRWEGVHRDVAIATQSTFSYVRNEIVRSLTLNAPEWHGIVEEGFPIEALTDPRVFYDAVDSPDRHRANAKRMVESCAAFLSLERVDSHPMSEYRFY